MYQWLVTVRAADGQFSTVRQALTVDLYPLLRTREGCSDPRVTACMHCAGEHTYLATWASRETLEAFEASAGYRTSLDGLAPRLRVPPKRECWEILAG
jgi:hypothetical protein